MNNLIHFLNGKFVTEDQLIISPRDLGFSRGYAVADFLVTHNHQPFKLSEHINRLFKSAEIIGLKIPWNKTQLISWVIETLDKNDKNTEKMVKIILSGGVSHSMYQSEKPTIAIIIDEYTSQPSSYYENGVKIKTIKFKRPFPQAKTTNYVEGIKQLSEVKKDDISEIIYFDDSQVFEGAGSNIFAVINNVLVTPKNNIVEGITRKVLLEILHLSIPIDVKNFTYDELLNSSEVFLTGSSKGVRGVIEINGKPVGDGAVGKITKEVEIQFKNYILQTHK
ncbi:MAG: aminotransferase class IV [bacterium]|nr:aminotransferase class IV [bacterium]